MKEIQLGELDFGYSENVLFSDSARGIDNLFFNPIFVDPITSCGSRRLVIQSEFILVLNNIVMGNPPTPTTKRAKQLINLLAKPKSFLQRIIGW